MVYYLLKTLVSAILIVCIAEFAKRSSAFAALIASLPVTSLLAFIWLRIDGIETEKIANLSEQIFWLVIPSLVLFPLFAILLRMGIQFWLSLSAAAAVTAGVYFAMLMLMRRLGIGA